MRNKMIVQGNIYVCGVYAMATKDGKVLYVGSSLECNDALSRHCYHLKRNNYANSNKNELQLAYDREDLVFKILKVSESNDRVKTMSNDAKMNLQTALSKLEEFYIQYHKSTVINKQTKVNRHSSNKDETTTIKRQQANIGRNNPNCKYDEKLICNILFLKQAGLKPRKIISLLEEQGIDVNRLYLPCIGVTKWIHLVDKAIKPDWYTEDII